MSSILDLLGLFFQVTDIDLLCAIACICITVMSVWKTPHLEIFPLGNLFPGLCMNECCQYVQILCSRVISRNIWLPNIGYALLKLCGTKDFLKGSVFHPSPPAFLYVKGWAHPAPAVTSLQLFLVHPISFIPFLFQIEVMHDYQEKRNSLQSFISDSDDNLDILKG